MENFNDLKPDLLSSNSIEVDEQSGSHLKEAGLWAKAVAVIVSVLSGLVLIYFLVFGSNMKRSFALSSNGFYVGMIIGFMIVMAIASIGIIALFRFSNGMATGVNNQDATAFDKGIAGLKTYFIFIGVLTLIATFFTVIQLIK